MADKVEFKLGVTSDVGGAYVRQTLAAGSAQPTDLATGVGYVAVGAGVVFPTIRDELDLSVSLKMAGGAGSLTESTIPKSSPLSGPFDRVDNFLTRMNLIGNHLGVTEAFLTGTLKTPRLTFWTGVLPQESQVYSYDYNSVPCAIGDFQWLCSTSRSNPHDISSWPGSLLTSTIGFGGGLAWAPSFIDGLNLKWQTTTAWHPPVNARSDNLDGDFGKRSITSLEADWTKKYTLGDVSFSTFLAGYYSYDNPALAQNDKGEQVLPTHGFGLYWSQVIADARLQLGWGASKSAISANGLQIANEANSVTLGASYALFHNRAFVGGNFAWINYQGKENSDLIKNETSSREYTVDLFATVALVKGVSLTAGWNGFIADPSKQAQVDAVTFRSAAYLFFNGNWSFSWMKGQGTILKSL